MQHIVRVLVSLIAVVSDRWAAAFLLRLASIPRRPPVKQEWADELSHAKRIEFERAGRRVAWQWGEVGPLVVCVHGWEGVGAQFGLIGRTLAANGFRCVAIDLTAHGESGGKCARFADFPPDINALIEELGEPPAAVIGHSAGGMMLMAARHQMGLDADKYIVIASPSAPFPPVEIMRSMLSPPEIVIDRVKLRIADQFGSTWDRLMAGYLYSENPDGGLLLIYDESDRTVHHEQGDVISQLWPKSRLIKTSGLGHNRVLWDHSVVEQIRQFIQSTAGGDAD